MLLCVPRCPVIDSSERVVDDLQLIVVVIQSDSVPIYGNHEVRG